MCHQIESIARALNARAHQLLQKPLAVLRSARQRWIDVVENVSCAATAISMAFLLDESALVPRFHESVTRGQRRLSNTSASVSLDGI